MALTKLTTKSITGDTLDAGDLAANSVDSSELVDGSIDTSHIGALQVTTAKLAADAVDGTKLADDAVNSEHYTDGSIDTAHIADDQITLAKMASGTDGNIISYDASGNPVAIATGNDGQVLTSAGAGQPPAFEASAGFDVTSITGATALTAQPASTDEIVLSDAGTLKRLDFSHIYNTPAFRAQASAGVNLTTATSTKFPFNKVDGTGTGNPSFNTGGTYDTTNYRWTPGLIGKYFVSAELTWYETGDATEFQVDILMNATTVVLRSTRDYESNYGTISCNGIVNVENTTDYYECRGYQNGGTTKHFAAYTDRVHFEAFRIVGA